MAQAEDLIVDSSTAIKWFIDESDMEQARDIFARRQAGTLRFLAPDLIYSEFGNILWKKHLFQSLPDAEAQAAIEAFGLLPFLITPASNLLEEAFRLAVTYRRSVYDSLYLALSLRENCRFITADEKLVNALGGAFPNVVSLANWH